MKKILIVFLMSLVAMVAAGQEADTQKKIESAGNSGIVISDTDNLVTLMYAKAYVEDPAIDLTEEDYKTLETLAWNIKRGIQ